MFFGIDLYSDTMTRPSAAMRQAMVQAVVGDEQIGEDPTTRELERMVAKMLGHEAAMFFPSATMANEVALRLLSDPGDEVLAAEGCHLFAAEAGGPAIHASLMTRPISTKTGIFNGDAVRDIYRWAKSPHYPRSRILSVENTTNMQGGFAWDLPSLTSVLDTAEELQLKTHLDGARLFNAAVKTNVDPHSISARFDTVTVCLSKGLGCPFGAVLTFAQTSYDKVRRYKQLWGGALRQSGIIAAAGIYALEHNISRLADDHANAAHFANRLVDEVKEVRVENPHPSTNMVFFEWLGVDMNAQQFNQTCIQNGLRFSHVGPKRFRAVTHLDITRENIDAAVEIMKMVLQSNQN